MNNALNEAMKSAGLDELTPVDTVFRAQVDGWAFLAVDEEVELDMDDMIERCYGGEPCFLTATG